MSDEVHFYINGDVNKRGKREDGSLKAQSVCEETQDIKRMEINIRNEINAMSRHVRQNFMKKLTRQLEECMGINTKHQFKSSILRGSEYLLICFIVDVKKKL